MLKTSQSEFKDFASHINLIVKLVFLTINALEYQIFIDTIAYT